MADEFSLPGSSYGELEKIIQAYFIASTRSKGAAVAVPDVANLASVHDTIVSRNNKFLQAIGVIEPGQKKRVTPLGERLGLAVDHHQEEQVAETWAQIVSDSDFMTRIINAVRIRKGMDAASLQSHIALTAGVPKSAGTSAGSNAVLEILTRSRRLVDIGGTLTAVDTPSSSHALDIFLTDLPTTGTLTERSTTSERVRTSPTTFTTFPGLSYTPATPAGADGTVTFNFNIAIDGSDPERAAAVIRAILQELSGEANAGGEPSKASPDTS